MGRMGDERGKCRYLDIEDHRCRIVEAGVIPRRVACLECIVALYKAATIPT